MVTPKRAIYAKNKKYPRFNNKNMPISNLKKSLKQLAEQKKLEWPDSRDRVVWNLEGQLNASGVTKDKFKEVMDKVKSEFHKDIYALKKISEFDLRKIENDVRISLGLEK